MSYRSCDIAPKKTDRFRQTVLDHDVESLQGYLGLGMQRQCLATAKRLLRRPQLTAHAFAEAVDAILIQGCNLRHWQPWIEVAYERLSFTDRKLVRFQMLGFYVSREEWKSAEHYVPETSSNAVELLFAMWTLLELRRDSSAERIYRQCLKAWRAGSGRWVEPRDEDEEMKISALIEAIASYFAQVGRWRDAADWYEKGIYVRPFTPQAWEGLLKIATIRAINAAKCAQKFSVEEDWYFANETALQIPRAAGKPKHQDDQRRFRKFEAQLSRVVPENERFHFNATLL